MQDSKTGLIGVTRDNFPLHAIVATDRLVPFYTYVHRPIQRVAQIVNTILSLQGADDALARSRGSAREALAAINLLGLVGRQSTYRTDVKEALVRSHAAIVAMQREDGSFPDTRSRVPESHLFYAPALDAAAPPLNDLLSVWMRVLTLTIIEHRYPDAFPAADLWQFHAWPGLGYHASSRALTNHERRVLPQWIRPTAYPDQSRADAVTLVAGGDGRHSLLQPRPLSARSGRVRSRPEPPGFRDYRRRRRVDRRVHASPAGTS